MKQALASQDKAADQARYEHLCAETARVGMERLGDWKGFNATYWFRCHHEGHQIERYLTPFTVRSRMRKCQVCLRKQYTQQLHTSARAAGIIMLSEHWLGEKEIHDFRCAQGHAWKRTGRTALANMSCPVCDAGQSRKAGMQLLPNGLKRLQAAAKRQNGECLSQQYVGAKQQYEFRCSEGHIWQTRGSNIMGSNQWCPRCQNQHWSNDRENWRAEGLARLLAAASEKGGECLTQEFSGTRSRYRFRCAKGHEWETQAGQVLLGSWCKACATLAQRLTIEDAQRIAQERGGQCLSTEYVRCQQKLNWLCHRGHSWHSAFTNIRRGTWCPTCKHMNRLTSSKSKLHKRYEAIPL